MTRPLRDRHNTTACARAGSKSVNRFAARPRVSFPLALFPLVLGLIEYKKYQWEVIGDFKIVAYLMGLQGGYTKFPCFKCFWNSRADELHYTQKIWEPRVKFLIGKMNVINDPLVEPKKIIMPPLHIKIGLLKQFVKALDCSSDAYMHLCELFPKLSPAKVKAGIFVGPQIKKLMADPEFSKTLTPKERAAWESFISVVQGFLGNDRADDYAERVENLVRCFGNMGCRMSFKLHVLNAHLDDFKENLGKYSEEQGERFHQDIRAFEERYQRQGQYTESMMGEYIWSLVRDTDLDHRRKSRKTYHFQSLGSV